MTFVWPNGHSMMILSGPFQDLVGHICIVYNCTFLLWFELHVNHGMNITNYNCDTIQVQCM